MLRFRTGCPTIQQITQVFKVTQLFSVHFHSTERLRIVGRKKKDLRLRPLAINGSQENTLFSDTYMVAVETEMKQTINDGGLAVDVGNEVETFSQTILPNGTSGCEGSVHHLGAVSRFRQQTRHQHSRLYRPSFSICVRYASALSSLIPSAFFRASMRP